MVLLQKSAKRVFKTWNIFRESFTRRQQKNFGNSVNLVEIKVGRNALQDDTSLCIWTDIHIILMMGISQIKRCMERHSLSQEQFKTVINYSRNVSELF